MGVVFSHQTALALYRHPDALYYPGADPRLSRMRHDHYGKPNAKGIAVAHDLCVLLPDYRGPVHVVVSCQEFRYRAKNIAWHVARDTVPVAPLTAVAGRRQRSLPVHS